MKSQRPENPATPPSRDSPAADASDLGTRSTPPLMGIEPQYVDYAPAGDYLYDVFISCPSLDAAWTNWYQKWFRSRLLTELLPSRRDARLFLASRSIQPGAKWPPNLAHALSHSRVMLALLCPAYFESDWCTCEMQVMIDRASLLERRTGRSHRLIVPIATHDGDNFPEEIKLLQSASDPRYKEVHRFAMPQLPRGTPRYQEFMVWMHDFAEHLHTALDSVPAWEESYCRPAEVLVRETLRRQWQGQRTVPRFR